MAAHEILTVICPDRHQRTQPHMRVAIGVPHANGHGIMVIFHAQLNASFGAPGSLRCVGHVEDVGNATHESDSARTRVKVTDLAFKVLHLGLPGLDGRWFQGVLEFLGSETITDGRAGRLLCE